MNTSESIKQISSALLKAQKAITFAAKDAVNPHFKSKYADLPTVIDAVKPALNDAGIVFLQLPAPSEPGTLALTTRLMHESGEWIESTAVTPLQKCDPQGYGSAMTYMRRYSLAAAVGLYQDDDDGHAASQPVKQAPRVTATAGAGDGLSAERKAVVEETAAYMVDCHKAGKDMDAIRVWYAADTFKDNDERVYCWSLLGTESKLRSTIKANKPEERKAA